MFTPCTRRRDCAPSQSWLNWLRAVAAHPSSALIYLFLSRHSLPTRVKSTGVPESGASEWPLNRWLLKMWCSGGAVGMSKLRKITKLLSSRQGMLSRFGSGQLSNGLSEEPRPFDNCVREITSGETGCYGSTSVVSFTTRPCRKTITTRASPGLRAPILFKIGS